MTETEERFLKVFNREIEAINFDTKWEADEMAIIGERLPAVHAKVHSAKTAADLRIMTPEWNRWTQRFDRLKAHIAKSERRLQRLRARVDALRTELPQNTIDTLREAVSAMLDGSHRLQASLNGQEPPK